MSPTPDLAAADGSFSTTGDGAARRVEVRDISKRYAGVQALTDVNLNVSAGEIHALVGENGAGKSTLGRIMAGAVHPDGGQVLVDGTPVTFKNPRDALGRGIAMVRQEVTLVPSLSVLDNVFLGAEHTVASVVQMRPLRQRFQALNDETGFELDPDMKVSMLRVGDQQKVEILRAIVRDAWLIVMDEPTAPLTDHEANGLIDFIRHLRRRGMGFVYISHHLEEVLSLADSVTVLKNGCLVSTTAAGGEQVESLVTKMLGRPLNAMFPSKRQQRFDTAPVALRVEGLTRGRAFRDVSFEVRTGEIVGMAGLVGSGRTEVARAIFGADPFDSGTVEVGGKPVRIRSPRDASRHGVALVPESRKDEGLIMNASVTANLMLPSMASNSFFGPIRARREQAAALEVAKSVDVRMQSLEMAVSMLSGGNQQKVAIGKWLVRRPSLLIADEPTRGVDVGARLNIYQVIQRLANEGLGVLLISSELEEIMGLADRILVMHRGQLAMELPGDAAEDHILSAAFGRHLISAAAS